MNNTSNVVTDNGSNNVTHLSFEEYFEGDWRKHFQEKDTIQSILDAAGLSGSHDFVQINSRYLIDDNRIAIIALLRRKNAKLLDKLIIDVASCPTFEQLIDVVYNIGSDCDYRVILYDQNSRNHILGGCTPYNPMCQLINHLDGHLFLNRLNVDAVRDKGGNMKVNYTVDESATKYLVNTEMPDRREFEYAQLYCCMESTGYDEYWYQDPVRFDSYRDDDSRLIKLEWKEDGIVAEIALDQDEYTWLFTKEIDEITMDDCSYAYDSEEGILTISENIPFQNFRHALPKTKFSLGGDYHRWTRIGDWIEQLVSECHYEKEEQTSSLAELTMRLCRDDESV